MCDYTTIEKAHPHITATENFTEHGKALSEKMVERIDLRRLLLKMKSATEVDAILGIGGEAPDPAVKKKLENPTTKTKAENNDVVITAKTMDQDSTCAWCWTPQCVSETTS